jgi:hypothetical protein
VQSKAELREHFGASNKKSELLMLKAARFAPCASFDELRRQNEIEFE